MASLKYSFGTVSTNDFDEITILSRDDREIVRAIFEPKSLELLAFRFFGIETHDLLIMQKKRAASVTLRFLKDEYCNDFAHYWNVDDRKSSKTKADLRHHQRVNLMSNALYHFYLSCYQVKLLGKDRVLHKFQEECDSSMDHCSYSPDGWWGKCCCKHDLDYDEGGVEADRKFFDKCFYYCLRDKAGRFIAFTYYTAVRIFGASHFTYREQPNGRRTCRR